MKGTNGPAAFWGTVDLASAAVGGEAMLASDDFFAEKENLVKAEAPEFLPEAYTDRGKLMDGWESRRKRVPGHDWCIVRLGAPGRVVGVDVDTSFFLGNHPPFAEVEGVFAPGASAEHLRDAAVWRVLVPSMALDRGSHNLAACADPAPVTHVRLRIYPDGGVARLRVYGVPLPTTGDGPRDLAALENGGLAVACSDMFFSPMNNLLQPFPAKDMGGGWETRRSRPPGADHVVVRLGQPGRLDHVVVDTKHFKGNFPDRCAVDALCWPGAPPHALAGAAWTTIVPMRPLQADHAHTFPVTDPGPWSHVRLRIEPDGGVSRLRVWGTPDASGRPDGLTRALAAMSDDGARAALSRCNGSSRWVDAMLAARPFVSRAALEGVAHEAWWRLERTDWLEAFGHHPRIGGDQLRAKFAPTAGWSSQEQAGVAGADEATLQRLVAGNAAYEARYGWIFLVCASGLSASELADRMEARLHHSPENELRIAAGECLRITLLRLAKLEAECAPR
jgi:allantoicase